MITVSNLTKRYGSRVAVSDMTSTSPPAESPVSSARTAPASRPPCG